MNINFTKFKYLGKRNKGYHLRWLVLQRLDINGSEVSFVEILPVECFGEVIAVIDEEAASLNFNSLPNVKIFRSEVLIDLLIRQLKCNSWECGVYIATILWNFLACNEDGEWVSPIIW